MGTKAKLSTKVISIVLSALMALSCVYVALPSLAPKAFAATAEEKAWQELHDAYESAFNGGYLSTKDWTAISSSGGTVTVTDGTKNGYAYRIVAAIGELIELIGVGKHNSELIATITSTLAASPYSMPLNTYQRNFLNTVLDTSGIYGTYSPDNIWNGTNAALEANLTAQTITITATREESAAILSDFASIDELAAAEYKISKSYSVTITGTAKKVDSTNSSETGAYYVNSAIAAAPAAPVVAAAKTDLQNIKAYLDYVASDDFKVPFETWYNEGNAVNTNSLYELTSAQITAIEADYGSVKTGVQTGDAVYVEEYIGSSVFSSHQEFVTAAHNALAVVDYKDYVAWLVNGTPLGGSTRNRDDYEQTDPESIQKVLTQAAQFRDIVANASPAAIEALEALYPGFDYYAVYDPDDSSTYYKRFPNYVTYLTSLLYNYYLQEIKAGATVLLNNGASTTYTFSNETSQFFKLLSSQMGAGYLEGTNYVKTSDTHIDQDKTYYTPVATYSYAATEDTKVNSSKHYFTNWAKVESPVASGLAGYYEDVEVFTYKLTEDTELKEKDYYTLADGVYTKVEEPAVEDIATYYERTGSYHTYQLTADTVVNALKTYYTQSGTYTVVTSPSDAYIGTYAERTAAYTYQLTADKVLMSGKTYYTSAGEEIEEPKLDDIATYYEIKFQAVSSPTAPYLFDYYEKVGAYYGLKGVGDGEYVEANYESSYSKTSDTAIDSTKTYYTYNEETGVYTKVTSPVAADLDTYYERAVCPIDDTDLSALYTFFDNAVTMIADARSAGVNIDNYMDSTFVAQISDMADALEAELYVRGKVTEAFLQAYQPAADMMAGYIKGGKSIPKLYEDLKTMEAKRSSLNSTYSWFADDPRDAALANFIAELYCEIYDRVQAQYIEIQNEYKEYGNVNVRNYFQLKQNINRLNDLKGTYNGASQSILTFISNSYAAGKISGTNDKGFARNSTNLSKVWYNPETLKYEASNVAYSTIANAVSSYNANNAAGQVSSNQYSHDNITRYPMDADWVHNVAYTAYFTSQGAPTSGNKNSVLSTVQKLDNFLANADFVKLLGVDEQGKNISTLTGFIQDLLAENLFTDKMLDTLVSLLFPMLTGIFDETVPGMLAQKLQGKTIEQLTGGSAGGVDINGGTMWFYFGGYTTAWAEDADGNVTGTYTGGSPGSYPTNTFIQITSLKAGINIYPSTFGAYLAGINSSNCSSYGLTAAQAALVSAIGTNIRNTGNQSIGYREIHQKNAWDNFKNADGEFEFNGGNGFNWGIDAQTTVAGKYSQFKAMLGALLGSCIGVLRTLFGNVDFNINIDADYNTGGQLLYGYVSDLKITYGISSSGNWIRVKDAKADVKIYALNLYKALWIPLMEALGMNASDGGVFSWSVPNPTWSTTTGPALAGYLVDPIYQLILAVSAKPVESVCKLLPNLAYHLMDGSVQNLLDIVIKLNIKIKDIDVSDGGGGAAAYIVKWDWVRDLLLDALSSSLNFDIELKLKDMLNIEDLLGFKLSDLNTVVAGVIAMIQKEAENPSWYEVQIGTAEDGTPIMEKRVNLPGIATGKLATMFKANGFHTGYSSNGTRPNGWTRTWVAADVEYVFYAIFNWVFRAAQTKGGLGDILALIEGISGSSLGDKLPQIVYALVEGIESADLAFAALIELLNEPEYDVALFNWFDVEGSTNQPLINWSATTFTYLNYSNKWTEAKAKYVYDNVDNIVNAVVNMITPETLEDFNGDVNVWLDKTINSMFNNEGIMNVVEVVTMLGNAVKGANGIVKLLKQQLTSSVSSDPEVNLYAWYNVFGYIYDEYREVELDTNQFLAYNAIAKQVYVYEAEAKDKDAENFVATLKAGTQTQTNTSASDYLPYTWKIVQAYPVAPGETITWTINGQSMSRSNIVPYNKNATNDAYQIYENLFKNVRWTEAEDPNEGEDPYYTWEVKLTSDIIGHLYTDMDKKATTYAAAIENATAYPVRQGDSLTGAITGYREKQKDGTVKTYNTGAWYPLVDGANVDDPQSNNARAVFSAVFSELIGPFSTLFSFILYGKDLNLFGNNLTIQGYNGYNNAIIPFLEALGIYELKTAAQMNTYLQSNGTRAAFDYLVNKLFEGMDELLTDDRVYDDQGNVTSGKGAFQKLIDVLPHLYYFLQSDGLTTVIRNLPMFVWQLLDTLRPIANIDLDNIVHALLCRILKYVYKDEGAYATNALTAELLDLIGIEAPKYTDAARDRDAEKVAAIFRFSLKNLTLEGIYSLVTGITGLNLYPLTYALEGMCQVTLANHGIKELNYGETQNKEWTYTSYLVPKTTDTFKTYTLNFEGQNTITVTLEALLDILKYEGNAAALDELFGTVSNLVPGAANLLTGEGLGGLIQAIVTILDDQPYGVEVERPNWDYIFENKHVIMANGNQVLWENILSTNEKQPDSASRWAALTAITNVNNYDFSRYHDQTLYNLQYLTSWTESTAEATYEVLASVLDYIISLAAEDISEELGEEITTFSEFVDVLLSKKVFTPALMIQLLDLLAEVYNYVPDALLDVINHLLTDNAEQGATVNMFAWREAGYIVKDYPWHEVEGVEVQYQAGDVDDDGEPIEQKWQANRSYAWFNEDATAYYDAEQTEPVKFIDSEATFIEAIGKLLEPAGTLFALIFLKEDYNLLQSMNQNSANNNDAVVINATAAYATALIPIIEALGVDLEALGTEKHGDANYYKPYTYKNTDDTYDGSRFVNDLVEIVDTLFNAIIYGPVNAETGDREGGPVMWLIQNLPNIIYFINANGIKASINNVFSAINGVIDAIETVVTLPIDFHNLLDSGLDLTNLTFEGIFGMIYTLTKSYTDDGTVQPGLYMSPSLLSYLQSIYIGKIEAFTSANGFQSFRMVYSHTGDQRAEEEHDMITIILAALLEYATDSGTFIDNVDSHGAEIEYNNADALDRLLFSGSDMEGAIGQTIYALRNPQALTVTEMDWRYFDHEYNLSAVDEHPVTVDAYQFQYLNWTTEWTYTKADTAADEFENLIFQVLKMLVPSDPDKIKPGSLIEKVAAAEDMGDILSIDSIFSADLLTTVLDFMSNLLYGEDSALNEDLVKLIGYVLGGDLTQWNGTKYGFATLEGDTIPEGAQIETVADITGNTLYYLENQEVEVPAVLGDDGETVITPATTKTLEKQYLIREGNQNDFIAGLVKVLEPAQGILGWLLFGMDYTFFNPHDANNEYLITIPGSNGYKDGLALALEALDCDSYLKYAEAYIGHTDQFVYDLAKSIAEKALMICTNPVDEIIGLLPELIYFINAGGLSKTVTGLLSGPLGLVNQVSALGPVLQNLLKLPETVTSATDESSQYALVEQTVDSLIKSLLAKEGYTVVANDNGTTDIDFTLTGVNLQYVFSLIEVITGMEITDVIGNKLDKFVIGQIHAYDSKSGSLGAPALAYKVTFNANGTQGSNDAFADFITILLSAVVDILEYKDASQDYANVTALAQLLEMDAGTTGLIKAIVALLKTELNAEILPIDWFYFDETLSRYTYNSETGKLTKKEPVPEITEASLTMIPASSVNYLTYASDWTKDTSEYIVEHFSEIIDSVLGMFVKKTVIDEETGEESQVGQTLRDIINDNFSLANNVFNYKNYSAVVKAVTDLATKIPDVVNTLLNIALEMDLSSLGSLATLTEEQYEALDDTGKKNAFVSAIIAILTPLRPIVEWFFFNQNIEYFDKDTDLEHESETDADIEVLISIGGASGYNDALVPLLEAIGVQCPSYSISSTDTVADRNVKFGNFLSILIEKVLIRVEEILQDPADAVINLLPNLIYFLNTNALATILNNLVAPLVGLVNEALPALIGLTADIDLEDPETDPDDIMTKLAQAIADNHITEETTLTMADVIAIVMALLAEEPEEGEAPADTGVLDYILANVNFSKLDLVAILRLAEGLLASGAIKVTEKDEETGVETTRTIQANIKLVDVVGEDKIDNFYLNDIESFNSAAGGVGFRMPGSADMITVFVNYLLEVLLYQTETPAFSNAAEIDKLIDDPEDPAAMVTRIVNLIYGIREIQEVEPAELDWNYWDDTQILGNGITVPSHKFVYLDYSNQWSFEKAVYIDTGLEDIVTQILTIAGVEDGDISKLIGDAFDLADYLNADTLMLILNAINGLFNSEDSIDLPSALTDLIGLILNVDITAWDGSYDFVAEGTATATDETYGLGYYESNGVRHYIINTANGDYSDFSSGLQLLLSPAQGLLGWLLLGNTFAFFVPSDTGNVIYTATTDTEIVEGKTYYVAAVVGDETVYTAVETPDASALDSYYEAVRQHNELIRVPGSKGYDTGLVLLMEALGCENVKPYTDYALSDGTYDAAALLKDVIDSLLARVNDILANPIEEILALIPELIYFINVGGLGAMVQNIASVLLAIVNEVLESHLLDSMVEGDLAKYLTPNNDGTNAEGEPYNGTYKVDLDAIMTDLLKDMLGDKAPQDFTFSFDTVDLQFVIDMVEIFTGLEIDDVVGYTMDKFVIGVVESYDSASETYTETYKLAFRSAVDPETGAIDNTMVGQTRADMITILISLAIDLLGNTDNVNALVELINGFIDDPEKQISAATINAIMDLLKGGNLDDMIDIDWFYFDPNYSIYKPDGITEKDPKPTIDYSTAIATPERTINYIQYYTDWTRENADYLAANINDIVSEVLALVPGIDAASVAELIAGYFTVDQLYTKDLFVTILDAIQGLIDQYGETLVNAIGLIIGGDFSVYANIDTESLVVNDKESFINTLVTVLEPIYELLNWFLFGEDMKYFYDNDYYNSLAANGGDTTSVEGPEARNLINLTGAEGYKYGLVPLLEALGVNVPDFPDSGKLVAGEDFMKNLLTAVFTRVENILADPVTEIVAMLPELLYFINAGGLTASVYNLLNAVVGLLPQISEVIAALGIEVKIGDKTYDEIDIDDIVNDLLANYLPDDANVTVNVKHVTLITIAEIVEALTGLEITDIVTAENIRYFYFGKLVAYPSGSGKTGFKMVYRDYPEDVNNIALREAEPEMLTLLINFLVEILLYKDEANGIDNLAALIALINSNIDDPDDQIDPETVNTIVKLITGDEDIYTYQYGEMKWNYFDETVTIKTEDEDHNVTYNTALTVPTSQFIYLEYENDWTLPRADGIDKNLAELVDGVMGIIKPNGATTVSALLQGYYDGFAKDTIFTADNLNLILGYLQEYLYGENAIIGRHLAEFAGLVLGGDITGWNYTYSFAEYDEETTYINEASTGLRYNADSGAKVYAIETEEDFINGLYLLLQPASNLLGWLLLGNDYNFFASARNHDTNDGHATYDILIKIPGTDAYGNALALLLEALGVEGLGNSASYNGNAAKLLKDILTGIVNRIDEILAHPVDEVLDLIPELIYFINANGLSVVVNNLVGPLLNIVNAVIDKFDLSALNSDILEDMIIDGKLEPIKYVEAYVTDLLNRYTYEPVTFTLNGVNTGWAVKLIEALTDVQIMEVLGTDYPISKFVLGTPTRYATNSNFDVAYKIAFPETDKYNYRCDLITIVLSFAIEFLENTHNQVIIEDEFDLTAGLIADVLALVKERAIHITPDYDWFYFDTDHTFNSNDLTFTAPERSINYLTYASNWDEDFADYLDDHLNSIIASVLKLIGKEDTTVADIIAESFKMSDVYTVENLETIRDAIKGLVEQLETALNDAADDSAASELLAGALDLFLDIDLHAWDEMTFDETAATTKEGFAAGLAQILDPLHDVIKWLFFGGKIALFNHRHTDTGVVDDILVINGYDGYNEGLVPLLEALGVDLTEAAALNIDVSFVSKIEAIITAALTRAEEILANPVDQVLALLPEILYFINANGLAASVNNMLGSVLSLVDGVNALLADLGVELNIEGYSNIDVNGLVNTLLNNALADKLNGETLEIDTQKLDLIEIVKLVEKFTGLEIVDVVTETKIDNFYLGQIVSYPSANGKTLFKMEYSEDEQKDRADMITVAANFVIEVALANQAKLEEMFGLEEGTIQLFLNMLENIAGEDYAYDWNYFWGIEGEPHTADAGYEEAFDRYATPDTPFGNYLTYKSDWTKTLANDLYNNLDTIINSVLAMTHNEYATLGEIINHSFTLYKGEYLNKILELVQKLYTVIDDTVLLGLADELLDIDLTYWQTMPAFEDRDYESTEFAAAIIEMVQPIYSVLDWLFLGKDITLFVDNAAGGDPENGGYNLIVIPSVDAYATGLVPILEALGVELPAYDGTQSCATQVAYNGVTMSFFGAIVNAILDRVNAILADPIPEVFELLPELLYFVNANGLSTAVYNMLGGVIEAVNTLIEKEIISLPDATSIEQYVFNSFGINIQKLDLVGIFNLLEGLDALHGLKLNEVFTADFNGDSVTENILEYFYIGDYANAYLSSASVKDGSKFKGYKLSLDEENKGDLLTMLLSVVLEVLLYDENEAAVTAIIQNFKPDFTQDNFHALKLLLTAGIQTDPVMENINWVYFWNYSEAELQAKITEALSNETTEWPAEPAMRTQNALKYSNNWNTDVRDYLNQNLESIIDLAIQMATKNSDTPAVSLSDLLDNVLDLWSSKDVNPDSVDLANLLLGYIKNALTKIDDVLVDTIGSLLGAEKLSNLKNAEARGLESKEDFVDFMVETLAPLSSVLDFVLFGGEFEFFTHLSDGEPWTIKLLGGEGYKYGLAPILAALGVDTNITVERSDVALREVFTNLTNRIDDILYGGDTVNEALKLILNVIYFIDADGLSTSVKNLLAPIDELLKEANDELHIKDELTVNSLITQVDLDNLNMDFLFSLVLDKTGINVADPIGDYLKTFYFGATEYFTSYGDLGNFRMVYSEAENRIDFITVVITLLLDVVIYNGNHEALVALVQKLMNNSETEAEQYVDTIVALLTNKEKSVPMKNYDWAYVTQYGDTGIVISAANGLTGESIFGGLYGPLYTRAMGEYISKFLPLCIDTYLVLLGVKNSNGDIYRSLEDLLKKLIGNSIYTNKTLKSIADAITGAVANLKSSIGEELFNHIVNVLNASLDVDLNDLLYGRVATITDGNEQQFIQAICDLLAPVAPILRWLLSDNYDIALFNHDTVVNSTDTTYAAGDDYLVLHGADGYQNAIIPILEALCVGTNDNIKTQAEFDAIEDNSEMISVILTPIFKRINNILDDPIVEVLKELPAVVYFLNSNGLDTAVKNLLNAVYSLLYTIEPLIANVDSLHNSNGEIDLLALANIDLSEINANTLIQMVIDSISDQIQGFDLTDMIGDAVVELSMGTVDSFISVRELPEYLYGTYGNGVSNHEGVNARDYTMHYTAYNGGGDQPDYVTILLRLILKFISVPQNVTALEALLKTKLTGDGYKFVCSLLENFSQMASTNDGMDKIMYTFYYIFYSALNAGVATNNGLAEFNGNYSFLNQLFATSNVGFLRQLEISLGDLLNKYTPEIVDDDEVIPQGQISFWQRIIEFFKKIGDFFKRLFGG